MFPNLVASSVANLLPPNATLNPAVAASRKREHEIEEIKPDIYGKVQRGKAFFLHFFFAGILHFTLKKIRFFFLFILFILFYISSFFAFFFFCLFFSPLHIFDVLLQHCSRYSSSYFWTLKNSLVPKRLKVFFSHSLFSFLLPPPSSFSIQQVSEV